MDGVVLRIAPLTPPSQTLIAKSQKPDLTMNSVILETGHPIGVKIIVLQYGLTMGLGRSKGQGDLASLKKVLWWQLENRA